MENCSYCGAENPENYLFCRNCKRQIKCKNCDCVLEIDADMCFQCGEFIIKRDVDRGNSNSLKIHDKVNIKADGSQSRDLSFDLNITDKGLANLSSLTALVPNSLANTRRPSNNQNFNTTSNNNPQPTIDMVPFNINASRIDQVLEDSEPDDGFKKSAQTLDESTRDFISKNFAKGEDSISYLGSSYPGNSRKSQQVNFIFLYTYAFFLNFSALPSKNSIVEALKIGSIYDTNWSTYLKRDVEKKLYVISDNQMLLTEDGKKKMDNIINPNDESDIKQRPQKSRKSTRSRVGYKDEYKIIVDKSIEKSSNVGKISVNTMKSPREVAALVIYIITKKLKTTNSLSAKMIYEYTQAIFENTSYNTAAISEGLNKRSEGFFKIDTQGLHYLSTKGEEWVMDWISKSENNLLVDL